MGTVRFDAPGPDETVTTIELSRALYSPNSPVNLISSGAMKKDGVVHDGINDKLIEKETNRELTRIYWNNNIAIVPCYAPPSMDIKYNVDQAVLASINFRTMHRRLMHAPKDQVIAACKKAGIKIHGAYEAQNFCEPCVMGKARDVLGKEAPTVTEYCLDFVRVDLTFHKHAGHLGYHYSVHIVDVHSGYHWVRFCKTKDDAYHQLKEWVTNIERQTGRKVKIIGLDGGTEFGQSVVEFQVDKLSSWASPKGITLFKRLLIRLG